MTESQAFEYDRAGVDTGKAVSALSTLTQSIEKTLTLRDGEAFGRPVTGFGYYANVLEMPGGLGLAIGTDGVGTKIIVAELAGLYDGLGIDLIAMNVNDVICVGAEPFAMVDYVAVGEVSSDVFDALGRGLLKGCEQSGITIPGGEIAQVKELLRGHGGSAGLDLVGTAVGLVDLDKVLLGADVAAGDRVVGMSASGLHSNGFTLARRVLIDGENSLRLDAHVPELGTTLAEELLRPTQIYVKPILEMLREGLPVHALAHLTGDGYCNLNRVAADVGFVIDSIPDAGGIYDLIRQRGGISEAEMFSVFNMGIGFCVILPPEGADRVVAISESHGIAARVIGEVTDEHRGVVRLTAQGLVGTDRLRPEKA